MLDSIIVGLEMERGTALFKLIVEYLNVKNLTPVAVSLLCSEIIVVLVVLEILVGDQWVRGSAI